jgi:hypothetical protein
VQAVREESLVLEKEAREEQLEQLEAAEALATAQLQAARREAATCRGEMEAARAGLQVSCALFERFEARIAKSRRFSLVDWRVVA